MGIRNYPAGTAEVLIQWKDLPDFEATWESLSVMQQQFPAFHLEYKLKPEPELTVID